MMPRYLFLFWLLLQISLIPISQAQIGGQNSFEFLHLSPNTRTAALGGTNISLAQGDVNMFLNNPALLDSSMVKQAALNFTTFYTGMPHTSLAYAHDFKRLGVIGIGLQYLNYGNFEETDLAGNVIGEFSANDFALTISKGQKVGFFSLGASLKLIGSQIANYSALAVGLDLGGAFVHPVKDLTIAINLRNIGFPISSYTNETATLPFDAQIGISVKPQNMPFRFSITAHHLQQFEIAYEDPTLVSVDPLTGATNQEDIGFLEQLSRHFVVGGELLLHKNFHLLLGYNRLINRELRVDDASNFAGLSFGLMFRAKSFEFSYTRATYHVAGARNYIGIAKDFRRRFRRK